MRAEGYALVERYQQVEACDAAIAVLSRWPTFASTLKGLRQKRTRIEREAVEIQRQLSASNKKEASNDR